MLPIALRPQALKLGTPSIAFAPLQRGLSLALLKGHDIVSTHDLNMRLIALHGVVFAAHRMHCAGFSSPIIVAGETD